MTAITSATNAELVRRIGAESVIDYAATPLAVLAARGQRYDVVFDAFGNIDRELGLRLLRTEGTLVLAVADLVDTVRARGQVAAGVAPERPADFAELMRLAATGILDPLTRSLGSLDSLVQAHRIVDSGHKVGNLVVLPNAQSPLRATGVREGNARLSPEPGWVWRAWGTSMKRAAFQVPHDVTFVARRSRCGWIGEGASARFPSAWASGEQARWSPKQVGDLADR